MKKSRVIDTLRNLPEEFPTEALIEKLLFIERVEKGIKDVEEGRTVTFTEAKSRFEEKWKQNP